MPSKPPGVPTKMKKPSVPPLGQTHGNSAKPSQQPSSSPSSAAKRLPGQTQNSSPTSATPTSANNTSRQNRRLQRITTRTGASDSAGADRKAAKKFPEPWGEPDVFLSVRCANNSFQLPKRVTSSRSLMAVHPPLSYTFTPQTSDLSSKMAASAITPRCASSLNISGMAQFRMIW